jgi:hypothetical protein
MQLGRARGHDCPVIPAIGFGLLLPPHAVIVKTTGNMTTPANLASWKYKLVAERGW